MRGPTGFSAPPACLPTRRPVPEVFGSEEDPTHHPALISKVNP